MGEKIYKNEVRLTDSRSVLKLLARTINALQQGQITESKAKAVGYLSQIMLRGFEVTDIDERVSALEQQYLKKAN